MAFGQPVPATQGDDDVSAARREGDEPRRVIDRSTIPEHAAATAPTSKIGPTRRATREITRRNT